MKTYIELSSRLYLFYVFIMHVSMPELAKSYIPRAVPCKSVDTTQYIDKYKAKIEGKKEQSLGRYVKT